MSRIRASTKLKGSLAVGSKVFLGPGATHDVSEADMSDPYVLDAIARGILEIVTDAGALDSTTAKSYWSSYIGSVNVLQSFNSPSEGDYASLYGYSLTTTTPPPPVAEEPPSGGGTTPPAP